MPRIDVNLDDVKDYVEPGWYVAQVVQQEIKTSKDQQSQYVEWVLEIAEPESEFHGMKVWHRTSLKPTALSMLKNFLEAAQFQWDADGFNTEDVVGAELEIKVDVSEYQGRMRNDVVNVRPL